jgi:hypothetical protein
MPLFIAPIVRECRMSLRKVLLFSELYYVPAQKIGFSTVTALSAVVVVFRSLGTYDYLRTLCYSLILWQPVAHLPLIRHGPQRKQTWDTRTKADAISLLYFKDMRRHVRSQIDSNVTARRWEKRGIEKEFF